MLAFPKNPRGMGVFPPLLKSVRERGAQGWELVSVTPRIEHGVTGTSYTPDIVWGFFKRATEQ